MPNWCDNKLEIVDGDFETMKAIGEFVKTDKQVFSLMKINPTPPELLTGDGWYEWNIKNWGTKWDIDVRNDEDDNASKKNSDWWMVGNHLGFLSAWDTPANAIATLSSKFPSAKFLLTFFEPGCGFAGKATIRNGEVFDETYSAGSPSYLATAEEFGYDADDFK